MLKDFFTPCCMLNKTTTQDGFGGIVTQWAQGATFSAGVAMVSNTEAKVAEQQGAKRMYTVVTDESITLQQNDRIKRLSDGIVLRVTSNSADMTTPSMSSLKYFQVNAEVVDP